MQKHYNYLDIDLDNKNNYRRLSAIQGDIKSRYILVNLYSNNLAYDLSDCTVKIYGLKRDKTIFFNNAVVKNSKLGQFEIELTNQALAVPGELKIQILVLGVAGEKLTSSAFFIDVGESIIDENAIESTNEFGALTESLTKVNEWDKYFEETSGKIEEKYTERLNEVDSQIKDIEKSTLSYLNAVEIGCDNKGITDCTTIIQDSLDKGYSVFFPNGIYKTGLINMKTNTKILGETKTGVVFKCDDTSVKAVIYSNKSNHDYQVENISINANYETNAIMLENTGEYEVQDLEIKLNNIKIVKAKTGLLAEIGRGSEFTAITAGDCLLDGIAIKTTDLTLNNSITAMCGRNGILVTQANNSINNCKTFMSGMSAGYGAGFKIQGSFNRIIGCEAQQNKYENLYLQNANGCIITGTILDGAGYKSDTNMEYQDEGNGNLIPISSLRIYNSKNNIIDIAIVNGRLDCNSKSAFYCQYSKSDLKNNIKFTTFNTSSRDFIEYIIDDENNYFENNDVKINGVSKVSKTWNVPTVYNNEVSISYGGYIVKDNICYVTISVKALNTYTWATEILTGFPIPINRIQLSISNSNNTAYIRTDGQMWLSNLSANENYIISGSYLIN